MGRLRLPQPAKSSLSNFGLRPKGATPRSGLFLLLGSGQALNGDLNEVVKRFEIFGFWVTTDFHSREYSTDEPFEQKRETAGGEWGGKAADQGEHLSIQHALDTERDRRVPRVDGCAQGSKGTEGDEVHRLAPPFDSPSAPGELSCVEAEGGSGG